MSRVAIPWLLSLTIVLGAAAQDVPTRIEEPRLGTGDVDQAQRIGERAKWRSSVEGGATVTYQDVLRRPDDVDLNYRYALSEVRKGNLRSAAATLERILMVDPRLPKVRLVHAIVLFRLDNLEDAQREVSALQPENMPARLRRELDELIAQMRRRRKSTHLSVLVGAGLDFDDNRNAAPASGQLLFFDTPITLDSDSTRKSDVAKIMLGAASLRHALASQAGHSLFLDYSYYRAEQTHVRVLNLQNHAADAGFVYKGAWVDVTPSFEFAHLLLTQTTYLRSHGGRLRMERKLTPRWKTFVESAYTRQQYNRTLFVPDGDSRTGDKWEAAGGLGYVLTPNASLLASFTHVDQGAAAKYLSYRRESFALSHSWLLGKGQFLLNSVIVNVDDYESAQPSVSAKVRRDTTYRARATYGVPLSVVSRSLESLLCLLAYEYYHADSNLTNYSYSDNKVSSLLTYKWEL